MRKTTFLILLCAAVSIPALGQAASPMKPGLWEVTTQSDSMRNMPKISPQQAAQMRQMGINVPEMRNGGMVIKMCYTREMAERNEAPGQKEGDCQTRNMRQSGNTYSAEIVCNGSDMKGSGTIQGTHYPTSFESNYQFKGTAHGQPVNQQRKSSGKWVGVDCGNVKPFTEQGRR